jgi:hypothetical protein
MSAPAVWAKAHPSHETASNESQNASIFGEIALAVSLGELLSFNSRHGGVVQTFPSLNFYNKVGA